VQDVIAGKSKAAVSFGLALMLALPTLAAAGGAAAGSPAPLAPGPLPNGTLPGGNLTNGTLPGGGLQNGTLPGGNFTNGTLPGGNFTNGTRPGPDFGNVPAFTDVTAAAGLANLGYSRLEWGDFDADGYDDIMFNGGALYRNNRDGTFSDMSAVSGTRGPYSGGAWGDYNNDGRLDYYATAWGGTWDTLFRNNGDGTFTNVTALAGMVKDDLPSEAAAWADYDRDGCLDLYVANYEWPPLEGDTGTSFGTPNILWHNNCDGTFTNATIAAGMYEDRRSRGVVWGDFNNDGFPDLYVANYRLDPNELWVNNRNGSFSDRAMALGVDCDNISVIPNPTGACGHSIGADFADFNNDGYLDLYVANLAHPQYLALGHDTSQMYLNRGPPNYDFVNIREASGILYCETASNPTFGDFDADGHIDLYVTSIYENRTAHLYRNRQTGDGNSVVPMDDVTRQTSTGADNGWGAGWSDYDRDGDLDLLVGSSSGVKLYRNPGNNGSYVELELVGRHSNKAAVGAVVGVSAEMAGNANTPVRYQEVQAGDGTGSQSSMRLFFGNPEQTDKVRVSIRWPSGLFQNLTLGTRQIYRVEEPEGIVDLGATALSASPADPVAGEQVTLTTTVSSVGTAPATSGTLVLYHDGIQPSNEIARRSFGSITVSQDFSIAYNTPASATSLRIYASLEDVQPQDQNPVNDIVVVTLTIRSANLAPVANLTASPSSAEVGQTVIFDGSHSSDDSGVSQYIFDFGDGASSLQNESGATHIYDQKGAFTARLTVIDDDGLPSQNDASVAISVHIAGQQPPTAIIDSITPPSPEMAGSAVTFEGHGESSDAAITGFGWTSSIDGDLSSQSVFQTTHLSAGQHLISFRVQDANGQWSDPVTAPYRIAVSGGVQIVFRNLVDEFRVRGVQTINGTAVGPTGVTVTRVEWKVDQSNFQLATGKGEWSFDLDTQRYGLGPHDITVQATDSDGLKTTRTLHVVFDTAAAVPTNSSLLVLALGAIAVVVAGIVAAAALGARKRKTALPPDLRRLPVVPPPPPIAPLPFPPRAGPPPSPRRRMKAVAVESKRILPSPEPPRR
jgi:hypothetical protein